MNSNVWSNKTIFYSISRQQRLELSSPVLGASEGSIGLMCSTGFLSHNNSAWMLQKEEEEEEEDVHAAG